MTEIRIVSSRSEIPSHQGWTDVVLVQPNDLDFDTQGNQVVSTYSGVRYSLIAEKERRFGVAEKVGRVALGLLYTILSFGFALISPKVRSYFTIDRESVRYFARKKIKRDAAKCDVPSGQIRAGYGEYIVYSGDGKREVSKDTYAKVYDIITKYHPLTTTKPDIKIGAELYEKLLRKVKKIDPTLEIAFIPRTLYELFVIRKGIQEDVKHGEICPDLNPGLRRELKLKFVPRDKCFHRLHFNNAGDVGHPEVKNIAYRINKAIIKKFKPKAAGFTYDQIKGFLDNELTFFKDHNEKQLTFTSAFNAGPTKNFGPDAHTRNPMGINSENEPIVQKAVELECSTLGQRNTLFYRGSECTNDSCEKRNKPYSLSYGSGLFAGSLHDGGATAFGYMRNDGLDAFAIPVPYEELANSPFYAPKSNALCQLGGHGEIFHGRTRVYREHGNQSIIYGVQNSNADVSHLRSSLKRETFISEFERYKKMALFLKPGTLTQDT